MVRVLCILVSLWIISHDICTVVGVTMDRWLHRMAGLITTTGLVGLGYHFIAALFIFLLWSVDNGYTWLWQRGFCLLEYCWEIAGMAILAVSGD